MPRVARLDFTPTCETAALDALGETWGRLASSPYDQSPPRHPLNTVLNVLLPHKDDRRRRPLVRRHELVAIAVVVLVALMVVWRLA